MSRRPTCHPDKPYGGRTLCDNCYHRARAAGTYTDYPRTTRPASDFADDFRLLRAQGHNRTQIAERMGMTLAAFDKAHWRARRAGLLPAARCQGRYGW